MSRPVLALVYLLAYLALTFGVRTWLLLRSTGGAGFRGVSGRPFSARWFGGVFFVLAMLLALAAPVAELLGLITPWIEPSAEVRELAEHVVLLGTILTFAAQQDMGTSWRIGVRDGERTELVTGGAFRLVRNPIFSAMILTDLGFLALLPNPLALASTLAFLLSLELQVRLVEEPHLLAVHGDAYRDYAARVGRFLPGLGRLS